ncbi:hypothetical protein [Pantoea sp. B65]|uniref:hypothetical protein n=1 Tax=Pantoea sp. B65 TaxID=2813359 RepID=UPI0039B68B06
MAEDTSPALLSSAAAADDASNTARTNQQLSTALAEIASTPRKSPKRISGLQTLSDALPADTLLENTSPQVQQQLSSLFFSLVDKNIPPTEACTENPVTVKQLSDAIAHAHAMLLLTESLTLDISQLDEKYKTTCVLMAKRHHQQTGNNAASQAKKNRKQPPAAEAATEPAGLKTLTVKARQWLENHRAPKNAFGRVVVKDAAQIYIDNEKVIKRLNITQKQMALFNDIAAESLEATVYKIKRTTQPIPELTARQRNWLNANLMKASPPGKATGKAVAKFYCAREAELVSTGISSAQLAEFYGTPPDSLQKRIRDVRNQQAGLVHTLTEENRSWLADIDWQQDADGNVAISEIATFFLSRQQEMKEQGVILKDLALFHDVKVDMLAKEVSRLRQQTAAKKRILTDKARQWLDMQRWRRDQDGNAVLDYIGQFWFDQQQALRKNNIAKEDLANYHHIPFKDLLYNIRKRQKMAQGTNPKLSEVQKEWLEKYGPQGDHIQARDIADFFIASEELKQQKIPVLSLAAHYGIPSGSVYKWIYQLEGPKLTGEEINWLNVNGPSEKAVPEDIAAFYLANQKELKSALKNFSLMNLALHYKVTYSALISRIDILRSKSNSKTPVLTEKAVQWFTRHLPADANPQISNPAAADLWLAHEAELKSLGISVWSFATRTGVHPSSLSALIARRKAEQRLATEQLTPAAQKWLDNLKLEESENEEQEEEYDDDDEEHASPAAVARLCIKHQEQLKQLGISDYQIAKRFGLNFETLIRVLAEEKKILKVSQQSLTSEAQQWLSNMRLQLSGKVNIVTIARHCLEQQQQIQQHRISVVHIAQRFDIPPTSLSQAISKTRKKIKQLPTVTSPPPEQEATAATGSEAVIKQEPDTAIEVRMVNDPSLRFKNRNRPVLIPPEDTAIAQELEQGPMRELLSTIDAGTLNFIQFPPSLQRNRAIVASATRRLRQLVTAAQDGTLDARLKADNHYALIVDEQHPELGTGLIAKKKLPPGLVLDFYRGVSYANRTQYQQAVQKGDITLSQYFFETSARRSRKKAGTHRRRPQMVTSGIGGHVRLGDMIFANTGEISQTGRVLASEKNNLLAVKAEHNILVIMTGRAVEANEELCLDYSKYYYVVRHNPVIIKTDPEVTVPLDHYPQLNWLMENIDLPDAWSDPVFEMMPELMAQSAMFRKKNACLVITDASGVIIRVIDSATGDIIEPEEALNSRRTLAVIQNDGCNHYNYWWAPFRNVSFSLMADGSSYQVAAGCGNRLQAISPSGFCMTEAAASALRSRGVRGRTAQAMHKNGQALRAEIKAFIEQADVNIRSRLEKKVGQ